MVAASPLQTPVAFPFDQINPFSEAYGVLAEYDVVGMMTPQPSGTAFKARHRVTGEEGELRFFPGPDAPSQAGANPIPAQARASNSADASAFALNPQDVGAQASESPEHLERRAQWRQAVAGWSRALSALHALDAHPNIQRVLAFGEVADGYYVLLQAIEGRPLRESLEANGARPLGWTLALAAQIAQALDFAGARGLAHGSLNPDTIVLYGEPPVVCLREFGLHSLNRKIISAYTSPEQTMGKSPDARSDIYAFGTLLYACLSARPPFGGRTREELCRNIQTLSPPPLLEQPVWARDVIARAMQRGPAHRYRLAVEIVTDLQFERSPTPLVLDPVAPGHDADKDWTLGRDIPAMALVETDALVVPALTPRRKTGLLMRLLGRNDDSISDAAPRLTLLQQIQHSLGQVPGANDERRRNRRHTGWRRRSYPRLSGPLQPLHGPAAVCHAARR